jgi:hypothetical protein
MFRTRTWRLCSAGGFARAFSILAQTDLEEHEQHGRAEPDR